MVVLVTLVVVVMVMDLPLEDTVVHHQELVPTAHSNMLVGMEVMVQVVTIMHTVVVEMVMVIGLITVTILLVHPIWVDHNLLVTNSRTIPTGINHTVLGVLAVMVLVRVLEVPEVEKVWS